MNFDELNAFIPYHLVGKEKSIRYTPYPNIVCALPGRHALDTSPPGGDFVVMVTDPVFPRAEHQFTHVDIFKDVESKIEHDDIMFLMAAYLDVICGHNPDGYSPGDDVVMPGIEFSAFLRAAQCLAVAEHRRYARYEKQYGGRYLPFRFAAGIAQGLWTAADAAGMQKKGRPGVEILEKLHGTPLQTNELMS